MLPCSRTPAIENMTNKKPTLKDWMMLPIVILVALIGLPIVWLRRKFKGKALSPAKLLVTTNEMRLIEEASKAQEPILINSLVACLKPFDAERQHIHSHCGTCPDELHLGDVRDRPRLTASREIGEDSWHVAAMEPIVWGWLGHTSCDLISLRVGDTSIGHSDVIS